MRHRKPAPPIVPRHPRMVSRGDGLHVVRMGDKKVPLEDLYVRLLGASWKRTVLLMACAYLLINIVFACAYLALGDGITNARPGSFADAFFFSVQTVATIGYGGMLPRSLGANLLVTLESMVGFAFYGMLAGLVFSKFSRPTARIVFSDKAIFALHNGVQHFMMRLINQRESSIVDAQAKLTLFRSEYTMEGVRMRRAYDLPLVRSEIPLLRLSWTVMHPITESSPLYGMNQEALAMMEAEIVVSIRGMDETLSQTVHARHSYIAEEIEYDSVFEDILLRREDVLEVRYDKFHNTVKRTETV